MSTQYSIGSMNQLADALGKVGFTLKEITMLRSDQERLRLIREVLYGQSHQIAPVEYTIDCDKMPERHDYWLPGDHMKHGQVKWDPSELGLYTLPNLCGKTELDTCNSYSEKIHK